MATQNIQYPEQFFKAVLDSMTEHIVVVDAGGAIHYVNRPWLRFYEANDGPAERDWSDFNYLDICDAAAADGDEYGRRAREGIEALAAGTTSEYTLEYPCHSPHESRWFLAHMTRVDTGEREYIVISHHNITQRRLAEEKAEALARTDGLTGVANRKHLDQFLDREWRRALRAGESLSVLLLDIDFFKPFNDHYGHQAGDECLRRVGGALQQTLRRATDLVARYGGEEFILVLGQSSAVEAENNAQRVLTAVRALAIPHEFSAAATVVTASIGVATQSPRVGTAPSGLIQLADDALYRAKEAGRDRFVVAPADDRDESTFGEALDTARRMPGS